MQVRFLQNLRWAFISMFWKVLDPSAEVPVTDAMYGGNLELQITVHVLRSLNWFSVFYHQLSRFYSMTRLGRRNDCPPPGILGALQETFGMLGGLKLGSCVWVAAYESCDDLCNSIMHWRTLMQDRKWLQDMDTSSKILQRIPTDELFPVRSMPLGSGTVPRPPVQGSFEGQRRAVPNA